MMGALAAYPAADIVIVSLRPPLARANIYLWFSQILPGFTEVRAWIPSTKGSVTLKKKSDLFLGK